MEAGKEEPLVASSLHERVCGVSVLGWKSTAGMSTNAVDFYLLIHFYERGCHKHLFVFYEVDEDCISFS